MTRHVVDRDFVLHVGDALEVLAELPAGAIDCAITSPPYWGLRDYGDDRQLGNEPTPELYVERLGAVFAEVHRVLAPHATLWLNLGDTYNAGRNGGHAGGGKQAAHARHAGVERTGVNAPGLKPRDLVGVPWRVAFALQAAGWTLRADVIWSKPNPMPSSVTNRPTTAHEYVFLLTKRDRYFYDAHAIREVAVEGRDLGLLRSRKAVDGQGPVSSDRRVKAAAAGIDSKTAGTGYRNARSVWTITTAGYDDAHFAVYPEELVRRCLLAGCPELVCRTCGKPRERVLERVPFYDHETTAPAAPELVRDEGGARHDVGGEHDVRRGVGVDERTAGWTDCGHDDWRRGIVLDPFLGSGTTALVARRHARNAVGIELSPDFAALALERTRQLSLESELVPGLELEQAPTWPQLELVHDAAEAAQ